MEDGEETPERPAAPKIVVDDGENRQVNFTFVCVFFLGLPKKLASVMREQKYLRETFTSD